MNQCVHFHTQRFRDNFHGKQEFRFAIFHRDQGGKADADRFTVLDSRSASPGIATSPRATFCVFFDY